MKCENDHSPAKTGNQFDSTPIQDVNTPEVLEVEIAEQTKVWRLQFHWNI